MIHDISTTTYIVLRQMIVLLEVSGFLLNVLMVFHAVGVFDKDADRN